MAQNEKKISPNNDPQNNMIMKKIALFLCFLFALGFLSAQNQQANYSRVKIFASSQEHFDALLQQGVCLENLDVNKGNYIIGEFSDYELEKIIQTQIPFEILIENISDYYVHQNDGYSIEKLNEEMKRDPKTIKGNRTPSHFHLGSMGGFLTLEEIMDELDLMRAEYPALISAKAAFPLQKVEGNHIYWVRISNNPDIQQEKPRVFYNSLTHAREPAGMQQLIYQMWDLLENYGVDPEITYYIDNLELYFVPCVNPDGYERNRLTNPSGGGMWRKNVTGGYGVDLNRNWGYKWGYDNYGSSPYQYDETYRGSSAFSEVETQALKEFFENIEFTLCLNNHTFSNLLVFPFGYTEVHPPEYPIYSAYSRLLTSENNYAYGNCYEVLNYYSNGDADDWLHGEQGTKKRVFGFTPEAGEPSEGFWPPVNRIEEICAGHVTMNKYMMRFALPFAEIEDKTDVAFQSLNCTFIFDLVSLGVTDNANFSVTIEPVSNNIESVQTEPLLFNNLNILDKIEGEISFVLKSDIVPGSKVVFDICVNNGSFTHKYRFNKFFGSIEKIDDDDCESMDNWVSSTWYLSNQEYVSPAHSITDSPYGNYSSNANRQISSKNRYNFSDAIAIFAEFYAKWEIEPNHDYVQFVVSDDFGATWTPQTGKYTRPGTYYQEQGKPMYDGIQTSWVRETIDLNNYRGKKINVGFILKSDSYVEKDGFYFDDFVIKIIKSEMPPILFFPDTISFFDVDYCYDFNLFDYVVSTNNGLTVRWEGNEHLEIMYDENTQQVEICANNWTGCENVTFTLENIFGVNSQKIVVECVKANATHTYDKNSFNAFYNAAAKKILINGVENATSFSLFNIEGKLLDSFNVHHKNHEINVAKLQPGIYFLKSNTGEVQKVVIY